MDIGSVVKAQKYLQRQTSEQISNLVSLKYYIGYGLLVGRVSQGWVAIKKFRVKLKGKCFLHYKSNFPYVLALSSVSPPLQNIYIKSYKLGFWVSEPQWDPDFFVPVWR